MITERHAGLRVPSADVERRITAFRTWMRERDLPLAWIEHLTDRLYLSGSAQDGVLLIAADDDPVFYVRRSLSRARDEASVAIEPYPGSARLLGRIGGPVGVAFDVTTASTALRLQSAGAELVDIAPGLRRLRSVKSDWELEQIRGAARQVTTLFGEIDGQLRPDRREIELAGWIEGRLRELGHGGTVRVRNPHADITMSVVSSGDAALYPTSFNGCVGSEGPAPPTASGGGSKRLVAGESVMLDIVTSHNGYHADTTRSYIVGGEIPPAAGQAHERCLEALRAIEARMRPGASCADIYREVSALMREQGEPAGFMGHGENRVKFFGHGVGLELDELPVIAEKFETPLEPGMVLAVEPKAFLRGIGPVGVENTYVVNEDGCESLCPVETALRAVSGGT